MNYKTQKYHPAGRPRLPSLPGAATLVCRSRSAHWLNHICGRVRQQPAATMRQQFRRRDAATDHFSTTRCVNVSRLNRSSPAASSDRCHQRIPQRRFNPAWFRTCPITACLFLSKPDIGSREFKGNLSWRGSGSKSSEGGRLGQGGTGSQCPHRWRASKAQGNPMR